MLIKLFYKAVVILYKSIFRAAKESHVIEVNPTLHLNAKGGGVPQEDRQALAAISHSILLPLAISDETGHDRSAPTPPFLCAKCEVPRRELIRILAEISGVW